MSVPFPALAPSPSPSPFPIETLPVIFAGWATVPSLSPALRGFAARAAEISPGTPEAAALDEAICAWEKEKPPGYWDCSEPDESPEEGPGVLALLVWLRPEIRPAHEGQLARWVGKVERIALARNRR
jgi:hypothetical protein